jgi:dipeptidyl aminopeptidase/acylaminoacyl peptidase
MTIHLRALLRHAGRTSLSFLLAAVLTSATGSLALAQERARLTYQDLMQVRQIQNPSISADGRWVALAAIPDRGDGEVLVHSADGRVRYAVPMGAAPVISADGGWVAMRLEPSFEARETPARGFAPRPGMALLDTRTGEVTEWERVQRFGFSSDGKWLARHLLAPERNAGGQEGGGGAVGGSGRAAGTPAPESSGVAQSGAGAASQVQEAEAERPRTRDNPGTTLVLRELATGVDLEIEHVRSFAFHEDGAWLAYVVASPSGEGDGVHLRALEAGATSQALDVRPFGRAESLSWWRGGERLAWVMADEDQRENPGPGTLAFWDGSRVATLQAPEDLPEGWILPASNRLQWSRDGERLFYGTRPMNRAEQERTAEAEKARAEEAGEGHAGVGAQVTGEARVASGGPQAAEERTPFLPFDLDAILKDREVDVWHTDDPLINSNQKQVWNREQNRTLTAVYHLREGRAVQLADTLVQVQAVPENPRWALGGSSAPYQWESTWTGGGEDVYLVDMASGEQTLILERYRQAGGTANGWIGISGSPMSQSPEGRFLAWFQDDHWHLLEAETGATRTLTEGLNVPFFDPDHDTPNPRGGFGVAGWVEHDRAVLIYDKYDVWQFPARGGAPVNLTRGEGRSRGLILRVLNLDPDRVHFGDGEGITLASFHEGDKSYGFFRTTVTLGGLEPALGEAKRFRVLGKARDADRILFTREGYNEFPDLWVADVGFGNRRKVTDVNPGLTDRFAWGTSELVEWLSADGVPHQGVVIKPGNYEPGKRYPVLTYFYEFMSHRLHEFNQPVVNHRPSFPIYASDGYIVFLPDVRFEVGRPGQSSLKAVVPGVKKLVDMGLADPKALGLHGHSWSGYTTAYIVTQSNLFAAAVAGAPVSNMTSAYGGIRWGTGLGRLFQYEMGQSRLRGSLFEARADYIENSPLFYADRVETPLVLMHGDEDEAVPWYQSIELYLALRRAGKQAVFLQYRGEPHHPRKYANKLDYSIKMKEFFDHFLKGAPAPEWWAVGVPYQGR